ncbi:MAG: hypothetical protein ACI9ES_000901 [Oceanospirillaceae bacterium]|jgi:hypothetical protein
MENNRYLIFNEIEEIEEILRKMIKIFTYNATKTLGVFTTA